MSKENSTQAADQPVLAIVACADGMTVAAIRDRSDRRYSVLCSQHRRVYSFYYTPADTEAHHNQFGDDVTLAAAKHAASRHSTPRVDSEGATS